MSASLVGSEMCIRDRQHEQHVLSRRAESHRTCSPSEVASARPYSPDTVSYTHLTLPTICSV
eukprot:1836619-Alexandrium_andersonii.AAC.1